MNRNENMMMYLGRIKRLLVLSIWVIPMILFTYTSLSQTNTEDINSLLIHAKSESTAIDKSIELASKAYALSNEIDDLDLIYRSGEFLGKCYSTNYQIFKAQEVFIRLYSIAKDQDNPNLINKFAIALADIYTQQSDYENALKMNLEALNICLQKKCEKGLADAYNNLSITYYYLINFKEALNHGAKAWALYKKSKDTKGTANALSNLAIIYSGLDSLNKALDFNLKALKIRQENNDSIGIAKSYANLGLNYIHDSQLQVAINYFNKALEFYPEGKEIRSQIIIYVNLGYSYLFLDKPDDALNYAKIADDLIVLTKLVDLRAMLYSLYSEIYDHIGDSKSAFHYLSMFTAIKDSIFNRETRNKIAELEVKIETEKENTLLKEKNKLQLIFFVSISILIIILLLLLYSRYKTKQQANLLLEDKNKQIIEQNSKLEVLNSELNEANISKDKFFSILAHDLKSPLWWFKNVTDLLATKFDKLSKERILEITQTLDDSAQNSLHLIENLLQWSRSQSGRIEFLPEQVSLRRQINQILAQQKIHSKLKEISIKVSIEESISIFADKNMLNSILRNLISNAIKFTDKKGSIDIALNQEDKFNVISVKDSGIGIDESKIESLFKIDVKTTTLGTNQEKGTGLGLIITNEFIQYHKGKLEINSSKNQGTTISVKIPKTFTS